MHYKAKNKNEKVKGWEITFEAPSGARFLNGSTRHNGRCLGICADFDELSQQRPWFADKINKWVDHVYEGGCSTHAACGTFRGFKRHLRKHGKYLPSGTKLVLVGSFHGNNIVAKKI